MVFFVNHDATDRHHKSMANLVSLRAIAFATALISPLTFAGETEIYGDVGGWAIASDPSLGYGCFILATYEEDTVLRFGFDPTEGELYMIIGDGKWKSIEYEKSYSIEVQFGDESPWSVEATGFSFDAPKDDTFLYFSIPLDDETGGSFVKEFMHESNVVIDYKGKQIANLVLTDSRRATEELFKCQQKYLDAQEDPFAKDSDQEEFDPFKKN
jgi:hypothetical protein